MKMRILTFLLVAAFQSRAAVADEITCTAKTWPLSSHMSLRQIQNELRALPRRSILHLAWGEMLRKDPKNSIAVPILKYLAGTEEKQVLRGYYKAMMATLLHATSPAEALKKWPTRPSTQVATPLTLAQICSLYQEVARPK